jgi:uncharacterized protein YndB with AHSA1/START domain
VRDSVSIHMSATATEVWALISDVTRIGEFSPETFEAEWLDGATGPAAGAKFRGHVKRNQRGPTYWSSCQVTECVPERVFAFAVEFRGKPVNTWTYRIEPSGDGVEVTESFALAPTLANRMYWALAGRRRGKVNREGMRTTLERMKAVVERTEPSR